MGTANSLAFKLEAPTATIRARLKKDPRIDLTEMQSVRWFTFAISSDSDLRSALEWLGRAYDAAAKTKKSK